MAAGGLNGEQHAELTRILGQRDADIGQALRAEIATVASGVAALQRDTAGVVEEIAKASRDFATQQQLVVNTLDAKATELDAKATELNDNRAALDTMMASMEASIINSTQTVARSGSALTGLQKTTNLQTSQMQIVAG